VVYSAGIGTFVFMPVVNGANLQHLEFTEVLHVPDLKNNLLSVLFLTRHRAYTVHITDKAMHFMQAGKEQFIALISENTTAFLSGTTQCAPEQVFSALAPTTTLPLSLSLWHQRFSHHSWKTVQQMHSQHLVEGMTVQKGDTPDPICEPCLAGKLSAAPFKSTGSRASKPLQLIHSDLHGPFKTSTHDGYRYWITFIDDCTKFRVLLLLKRKSDAFGAFKRYKAYAENQLNAKIKALQDDKGGEYMSDEFEQFCIDSGIARRHSVRNRPQQNGAAEIANRIIAEHCTSMLYQANLPPSFLGDCAMAYVHVWNMVSSSMTPNSTPSTLWLKQRPNVSCVRVFGCTAYVHVQKDKRIGIGAHMERCIFVGYPPGYKAWKFYNPVTKKFVISERAIFDERYFPGLAKSPAGLPPVPAVSDLPGDSVQADKLPDVEGGVSYDSDDDYHGHTRVHHPPAPAPAPAPALQPPALAFEPPAPSPSPPVTPVKSEATSSRFNTPVQFPQMQPLLPPPIQAPSLSPAPLRHRSPSPTPPARPPALLRQHPQRVRNPPADWRKPAAASITPEPATLSSDEESEPGSDSADELNIGPSKRHHLAQAAAMSAPVQADPRTYKEAMQRSDSEHWNTAALEEMANHAGNGTWELVNAPPGAKVISSGWVFKLKRNADGSIERYKARLVAKGYSQRPGYDFGEVFAPTFKMASLRLLIAKCAKEGMHLRSVDISHAFLNGDLEEDIYMKQPEGYEQGGPHVVCKLRKALYGLKQAARQWNLKLHDVLRIMGFVRIESDRSLYVYEREQVRIFMPVFIDDITFASHSLDALDAVVIELGTHFKLRDLGSTSFLLGIAITRDWTRGTISLSQRQYCLDILERFGMSDCRPVYTPMNPGSRLSASMAPTTPEDHAFMADKPYGSVVGATMYLATCTRPDIAYTVGVLARFISNPGRAHWVAAMHLLRYLKSSIDLQLVYGPGESDDEFLTYTDADHGGNPDNGKSTGGYLVTAGSGAISWSSKLQPTVSLSSTEAEYLAAVEAGKEILWLRNMHHELGNTITTPSALFIDNQSAIKVTQNPEHHGRMKHLDLRTFWLRDTVSAGLITPFHLTTTDMVADLLTKPLARDKVEKFRKMMGLVMIAPDAADQGGCV